MPPRARAPKRLRNIEIAQKFEAIADMLALQSANPFRVRAYLNAARTLRGHGVEMIDLLARGEDLAELEGIAEDLAGKIHDLALTGTTEIYETLKRQTPPLAFQLLEIPGLGPKRAHALTEELRPKPKTLADIARAAREERVREVSGFGPKGEAELLKAIEHAARPARRLIAAVKGEAEALIAYMRAGSGVREAVVAGSYRRGRESVGDLDLVVSAEAGRATVEHFKSYPGVADINAAGTTRAAVTLRTGLAVDMRVVRPDSFGAALVYFTGSKAHVVALRALARERGLKLNEYGLYCGKRRLAGATEADVYGALALETIPPELREARGEIEAARRHALPRLVDIEDIRGDLYAPSENEPISALAAAAEARGLEYLAIVSRIDRFSAATLRDRRRAVESAGACARSMRIFHALEVAIRPDGALSAPDSVLEGADLVIATVNSDFDLPRGKQSDRLVAGLSHPRVAVLAHPSGRIINKREPLNVDWPAILRVAGECNVSLGLSGDPERLDLTDIHCQMAREAGVSIAIGSEASKAAELAWIDLAVTQARRGWLEGAHVLNTAGADAVQARLERGAPASARRSAKPSGARKHQPARQRTQTREDAGANS
jgi:DNA polymerase (family 10)